MLKRTRTYQPQWYVELKKRVRSPCCIHPDNDKVIDYALSKTENADRTKQSVSVMEARKDKINENK